MNSTHPSPTDPRPRALPPVTLAPAIVAGLVLIAVRMFEWNLVELLTPFLAPLVTLPVLLLFVGVTIAAIVDAIGGLWRREFRRLIPLGVCLGSLALAVFVPWTEVMLDVDFRLHRQAREKVAQQILNGELRPNPKFTAGLLELPAKHRHLSAGGEVDVEFDGILFYTFRGVLDNFSGFVYSPSDFEPGFAQFGGDFKEIKRLRKHWFWVSSS